MGGRVALHERAERPRYFWKIQFDAYVIPPDERRIVIPFHYISLRLKVGPQPTAFLQNKFSLPRGTGVLSHGLSMLTLTGRELIADGPGYFIITSEGFFSDAPAIEGDPSLTGYFRPAGSPIVAAAIGTMIEVRTLDTGCLKAWAVGPRRSDLTVPWPNREDGEES
jgi:hypothetical protein